jgi:hypothetical protein
MDAVMVMRAPMGASLLLLKAAVLVLGAIVLHSAMRVCAGPDVTGRGGTRPGEGAKSRKSDESVAHVLSSKDFRPAAQKPSFMNFRIALV